MARTSTKTAAKKTAPAKAAPNKPAAKPAGEANTPAATPPITAPAAPQIQPPIEPSETSLPGTVETRPDNGHPGEQIECIFVRSRPETIRRCGFRFTQDRVGIARSELTDEQLQQLETDPDLVIEYGSVDVEGDE